ncbi:MAG: heavy-metal-associated domain-containing protein [Roseibium sp.]
MKFKVPDMSCGHCVAAIEKVVLATEPTATISCDLETRTVEIEGPQNHDEIVSAIRDAGYEPSRLALV